MIYVVSHLLFPVLDLLRIAHTEGDGLSLLADEPRVLLELLDELLHLLAVVGHLALFQEGLQLHDARHDQLRVGDLQRDSIT